MLINLHEALREDSLGGRLPYQNLAFFLELCHKNIDSSWQGPVLKEALGQMLDTIAIHNKYNDTSTSSNLELGLPFTDFAPFASACRLALLAVVESLEKQARQSREQYGGIRAHEPLEELMIKIGNCVDKTSLKIMIEQVFAIHAEQFSASNCQGAKRLNEIIKVFDRLLETVQDV